MDIDGLGNWATDYIGRGLDHDRFCYHDITHTRNVVEDSALFASASGCSADETRQLAAAAWLHDVGFVTVGQVGHEEESARIASNILPEFGATPVDIGRVLRLILATNPESTPYDRLEEIMRDADIGHTGTDWFWEGSALLRREFAVGGRSFSDLEWYTFELAFLVNFPFFTTAAKRLRREKREANAGKLKSLIAQELK